MEIEKSRNVLQLIKKLVVEIGWLTSRSAGISHSLPYRRYIRPPLRLQRASAAIYQSSKGGMTDAGRSSQNRQRLNICQTFYIELSVDTFVRRVFTTVGTFLTIWSRISQAVFLDTESINEYTLFVNHG